MQLLLGRVDIVPIRTGRVVVAVESSQHATATLAEAEYAAASHPLPTIPMTD
jgi:hypothetical protein